MTAVAQAMGARNFNDAMKEHGSGYEKLAVADRAPANGRVHIILLSPRGEMLFCGPVICGGGSGTKRADKVTCPRCRAKIAQVIR